MIEVEIWSDIVCPFCSIGKRNFEKALSKLETPSEVRVVFRSFELDPNAEKSRSGGIHKLLAEKYGKTIEWAEKMNANVVQTAAAAGLTFRMEKIIPTNSFDAHRVVHLASRHGKQNEALNLLFFAYFSEGVDIADPNVLKAIGSEIGIKEEEVQSLLNSDTFAQEVRREEEEGQRLGINGVPFFVFNREYGVSGAQPPEAFIQVFTKLGLKTL